jgi:D-serine deaminase-like pyridoxal phosphate-dependent protein
VRGERPFKLSEASTPALVLDHGKLLRNCERLTRRCNALGTRLRPHMKTLKSIDAARFAIDPSHGGIAVATLNEAEYFADKGLTDIQYAVCIAPDKLPRALDIVEKARQFSFFVDSLHTAQCAVDLARRRGARARIWLEIDCGEHRTGVDPEDPAMVEIARLLTHPAVTFEGLATHAGHSYYASGPELLPRIAENERASIDAAARKLRALDIAVNGVSIGSTPTATHLPSADGVTEVRAGVYMAGDLFQVAIGSLQLEQVAVTVLATVISHNPRRNQIVLDAGGLALSKDRSTASGPGPDQGYGLVLDSLGHSLVPDLTVVDVHQEHGEVRSDSPLPFERFPIGSKVRVVPNHICMTAAMYEHYLVVEGTEQVVDIWDRTGGWS